MLVSYLTTYNASDVHNWSGLGYNIAKAMEKANITIDYVGNLNSGAENLFKIKQLGYRILGKQYLRDREPLLAKQYAQKALRRAQPHTDVFFSPGTSTIAYLDSSKPKALYTDATFAGIIDYYSYFSNVCAESIKKGNEIEQQAFTNTNLAIFASDWAAQTAIKHYNLKQEKIKVIPFGANIECHRTLEDIKSISQQRSKDICRLLFLGVDWERKGGPMVLETAKLLNKMGLKTELSIVGLKSNPLKETPPFVKFYGFISKKEPTGQQQLDDLFTKNHFLFLPSRAEAFGVVFAEANSYGLPAIATKTGGITSAIKDHVSGMTFNLDSTAETYAEYIFSLFRDKQRYNDLSLSSFNEYKTNLNWEVAGQRIKSALNELL